jgi:hypothetical protein
VTNPVIAPESLTGVAASALDPARHTIPANTKEATVLCVRASSIKRRSSKAGGLPAIL